MRMLNLCLKVTTLSLLTVVFVACQAKRNAVTDQDDSTTLTYRLSQNGCDTGKHTFTSLESYCAGLANDAANNHCAVELRTELFAKNCKGSTARFTRSNTEQSESQQETKETHEEVKTSASEVPAELQITAHPDSALQAEPTESGDLLLSKVKGQLIIDSIEPAFDKSLILISAETITTEDGMGRCQVDAKKFDTLKKGSPLSFLLVGSDPAKTTDSDGCFARLATLAITGFTAEFTNVLVAGPSHDIIPKVVIKVKYK